MKKLLIIDDEPNVLYSLARSLRSDALDVNTALIAGQAHVPARSAHSDTERGTLDINHLVASLLRAGEGEIYRKVSGAVDRVVIEAVLRHVKGNQVQASEFLGISRTTLRAKLRSMGMAMQKQLLPESDQAGQ